MSQPVSLRKVQQDCGDFRGHRSKPHGSRGAGEKAGPTGLVWANTLVDVPAASWWLPESPVNVLAALWKFRARIVGGRTSGTGRKLGPGSCLTGGYTPQGRPTPNTGGRPIQVLAGTTPRTAQVLRYFLTLTGPLAGVVVSLILPVALFLRTSASLLPKVLFSPQGRSGFFWVAPWSARTKGLFKGIMFSSRMWLVPKSSAKGTLWSRYLFFPELGFRWQVVVSKLCCRGCSCVDEHAHSTAGPPNMVTSRRQGPTLLFSGAKLFVALTLMT